jgi:hypothetical protein
MHFRTHVSEERRAMANDAAGKHVDEYAAGKIEAGRIANEIMHHMDWLPTFLAVAGVDDPKEQLKGDGVKAIGGI